MRLAEFTELQQVILRDFLEYRPAGLTEKDLTVHTKLTPGVVQKLCMGLTQRGVLRRQGRVLVLTVGLTDEPTTPVKVAALPPNEKVLYDLITAHPKGLTKRESTVASGWPREVIDSAAKSLLDKGVLREIKDTRVIGDVPKGVPREGKVLVRR